MKLEWSRFAVQDRDRIFETIATANPRAAAIVDGRIGRQLSLLTEFPRIGRPGRVAGTRELVINRTPYIAAYSVTGKTIRILRILHGAQLWPNDL